MRIIVTAMSAVAFAFMTFAFVSLYVNQLLRHDAIERSSAWTQTLVTNVSDLPEIVEKQIPSDETVMFLEQARVIGNVWRFKIFDAQGNLILSSHHFTGATGVDDSLQSEYPLAMATMEADGIYVETRPRKSKFEPEYVSESIAPIWSKGKTVGYIGLVVDETSRRNKATDIATRFAAILIAIVLAAFGIPAIGFIRRSREKEQAESKLERLAYYDTLTGLKNRHAITQILDHEIARNNERLAIHIVDLDNFKLINDTMGHDAGDACLRNVTERLTDVANGQAIVGRIGGDEFLLVQTNARTAVDAEKLAGRIVREMKRPVLINNSEMDTSVSVGTALFPRDGYSSAELVKSADVALYTAKNTGRGCFRLYKPEYDEKLKRRRLVETKVRQAIEAGSFTLAFQPLLDLASGDVVSVEALIRLEDAELGPIPPAEFIPIAEEAGLIEEIGNWVIAEACRSLALLPSHIKVAVNLSAIQFSRGDLVKIVNSAIRSAGVQANRLELEITESLLLRDSDHVLDKIDRLKAIGCSLVLDDFGSGYSSLSYLWRYPFDKIKIDREFVSAMQNNHDVSGIVETVIALGKKLGMKVTAEGVETIDQATLLSELECDEVQGYLYARPLPMAELAVFLLQHKAERSAAPPRLPVRRAV